MVLILDILANPHASAEDRQAAVHRTHRFPGVPRREGSTKPFWLREPHETISQTQSEKLPEQADIAILGSGITGLSAAWTILQTTKQQSIAPPSVVILEARDACSGATGRNGGHLLETALSYLELKQSVGVDAARKIIKFRLAHLKEIEELLASKPEIRKRSQFRKVEFVSVYFGEAEFNDALESLHEFQRDMPEEANLFASHIGETLAKDFDLPKHAYGVITGPAGAVWPYRLVTLLLEELQRDFPSSFSIETNTEVRQIHSCDSSKVDQPGYILTTSRGPIQARQIIHCTNGHAGHLVPGFQGRVFPIRGQMSAQDPGQHFKNQSRKRSWLFNYSTGFDYLTQLPDSTDGTDSSGEMMLGGGLDVTSKNGLEEIGNTDDSSTNLYADIHLSGALAAVFGHENWGSSAGVRNMWTGIMGFSADGFPWVGKLPESLTRRSSEGQGVAAEWAAVGYSGEGMVQAWLSGRAVALMVLVQEERLPGSEMEVVEDWLPMQLRITEERIRSAVIPPDLSSF